MQWITTTKPSTLCIKKLSTLSLTFNNSLKLEKELQLRKSQEDSVYGCFFFFWFPKPDGVL